jgi:hypothetical protein
MLSVINERRDLTTFSAKPASHFDEARLMNLIANPADRSQWLLNLGRRLLVKVGRLFTGARVVLIRE